VKSVTYSDKSICSDLTVLGHHLFRANAGFHGDFCARAGHVDPLYAVSGGAGVDWTLCRRHGAHFTMDCAHLAVLGGKRNADQDLVLYFACGDDTNLLLQLQGRKMADLPMLAMRDKDGHPQGTM
jgi:hypothetical protein